MITINIIDEFKKYVNSLTEYHRTLFDYYCLGKRQNNANIEAYTLDEYVSILTETLHSQDVSDKRFVVFKSLSVDHNIVNDSATSGGWWSLVSNSTWFRKHTELKKIYNSTVKDYHSCFVVAPNTYKKAKFNFSFNGMLVNSGFVFLIHPSVQSWDSDEISLFAQEWDTHLRNILKIYPTIGFNFIFGNSKQLYSGNRLPINAEVKRNKLNMSMEMPIDSIAYEKE